MSPVKSYLQQQQKGTVNVPFLLQQMRSDFMELILLCNLGKTERASVSFGYKVQRAQAQATAVVTKPVSWQNAAVQRTLRPLLH